LEEWLVYAPEAPTARVMLDYLIGL
jgi:hypothetical protein